VARNRVAILPPSQTCRSGVSSRRRARRPNLQDIGLKHRTCLNAPSRSHYGSAGHG
jgi:hypothetical protein